MLVRPFAPTRVHVTPIEQANSTRRPSTRVLSHNDRRGGFVHSIRNLWSSPQLKADKFEPEVYRLLLASQRRRREQREFYLTEKLSFSWIRFLSGLTSLVLACSDVPRSGLAITHFPLACPALEPDVFQSFGPWFYSVQKLSRQNATNTTARVWSYKFDTTSVVHRAFAVHLHLAAFPDCVLYRSKCSAASLNGRVVFDMLDSIVDAAVDQRAASYIAGSQDSEPTRIALRSENDFLDRLHHYLAPDLFPNHIWRTNQLLYYPPEALDTTDGSPRSVCIDYRVHPSFCDELWTNFRRSCAPTDAQCLAVGRLWIDTLRRLRVVEMAHPTLQVDLTFLESQEDLQRVTGGLSPTAVWKSDVTTIIRARRCSSGGSTTSSTNCTTFYIDEYRYEVGIVYSDVKQWFRLVASLRAIGQLYVYVRVTMLFLFAYKVFDGKPALDSERPKWWRVRKMLVLICKMPMQSVIFGSPFPIFCYAGAHLIDSAISYEILSQKFNTQGGIFQLNVADLFTVGFNQMRSVWLLAAVFHLWTIVWTSRTKLIWSPIAGVLGVPEFLFSGISSLTIGAQYRSTRFRNTNIRQVFEVSDSPTVSAVRYRKDVHYRGTGNIQLGGAWIDTKFFLCTLTVFSVIFVARLCYALYIHGRRHKTGSHHERADKLRTRTPVPYSAGVLWPVSAMIVHWTSDYFCVDEPAENDQVEIIHRLARMTKASKVSATTWRSVAGINMLSKETLADVREYLPSVAMSSRAFRVIQRQMESLHDRGDDIDAAIAFMNLVNMSDPLVYFGLIRGGGGGVELGYFQSRKRRERFFLLPLATDAQYCSAHTRDLKLVCTVRSSLLSLSDLIHCG